MYFVMQQQQKREKDVSDEFRQEVERLLNSNSFLKARQHLHGSLKDSKRLREAKTSRLRIAHIFVRQTRL